MPGGFDFAGRKLVTVEDAVDCRRIQPVCGIGRIAQPFRLSPPQIRASDFPAHSAPPKVERGHQARAGRGCVMDGDGRGSARATCWKRSHVSGRWLRRRSPGTSHDATLGRTRSSDASCSAATRRCSTSPARLPPTVPGPTCSRTGVSTPRRRPRPACARPAGRWPPPIGGSPRIPCPYHRTGTGAATPLHNNSSSTASGTCQVRAVRV